MVRRTYARVQWTLGVALLNLFPLPRQSGFRKSFAYAGEAVDRGYSILVFPRGKAHQRRQPFPVSKRSRPAGRQDHASRFFRCGLTACLKSSRLVKSSRRREKFRSASAGPSTLLQKPIPKKLRAPFKRRLRVSSRPLSAPEGPFQAVPALMPFTCQARNLRISPTSHSVSCFSRTRCPKVSLFPLRMVSSMS